MDLRSRQPIAAGPGRTPRCPDEPAQAPIKDRAASWRVGTERAVTARVPLVVPLAIFLLAFLVPAWPWLSGEVTIPWDAKSQFFPQVQFLASSFARGEWPWWSPNVFAGWPQISDPQSLLFAPLYVLLAAFNAAISLRAFDAVTFAYLFLGAVGIILLFHERGCDGIRARRLGQCAHTAHRADRQPRLPAACALARGARARALVVARGPGGRRGRRTYGDRTRSGGVAVALRARRIRAGALGGG